MLFTFVSFNILRLMLFWFCFFCGSARFSAAVSLVIVFGLETERPEQASEQLPLLLIFRQSLPRLLAQLILFITLFLQLTDLRLVKGLAGGQMEIQLMPYHRSGAEAGK